MAEIKPIFDEYGIIFEAEKCLPKEFKLDFLTAIAELENNENHRTFTFPKTNLHKIVGFDKSIYRAYINKISGWRIHLQYNKNGYIVLIDIIDPKKHDNVQEIIKSKKRRYE